MPTCSSYAAVVLLPQEDVRALASAVPARLASGRWSLLYGTHRDGTSLRTLYRRVRAARTPGQGVTWVGTD